MYMQFLSIQNMFSIWISKELAPTLSVKMTILFIHSVQQAATPKEMLALSKWAMSCGILPTKIEDCVLTEDFHLLQAAWALSASNEGYEKGLSTKLTACFVIPVSQISKLRYLRICPPKGTRSELYYSKMQNT